MNREDIVEFARRDWARVANAKMTSWLAGKRGQSAAEVLAIGDQLRRHVQTVRPDWPTEAERAADLAVHARVAEALHAVGRRPR